MRKIEHLNRRLAIALRECEDADRVWMATMALDTPACGELGDILVARRIHAVWQEREAARERVAELQRRLDAAARRRRIVGHWPVRRAAGTASIQGGNDLFAGRSRRSNGASNPPA